MNFLATSRAVATALLLLSATGCYKGVPVGVGDIGGDDRVQLALSPAGADEAAEVIGFRETSVRGRLVAISDSSVSVLLRSTSGAGTAPALYQELRFDRAEVLGVEQLELDRTKTGLLVAAGALVAGFAIGHILSGEVGATSPPTPVSASDVLVPLDLRGLFIHSAALILGR